MSNQKKPGTIYFVEERDLLGFTTPNYVKIGLVKDNEKGRSSDDRKDEHQTGNPRSLVVVHSINTESNVSLLETMIKLMDLNLVRVNCCNFYLQHIQS